MPQHSSLYSCIPWTSVLPVLGVSVEGSALPAVVRCPVCQHQGLVVYKDPVRPGAWYHCSSCHFAGDGIELTAAVGGIEIGSAVLKLAARGLPIPAELLEPEALDRYTKKVMFRKQVLAFWSRAQASDQDLGNTGPAQRLLGIAPGAMHAPEWRRRGGRFVGHCTTIDAEELLRPGPLNYRRSIGKKRTSGVGWAPFFVGRNWHDLLVVPYRDMPGRISGLMFIGREARPEDIIFAACVKFGSPFTVGVAMFEAALSPHREFGTTVFVIEDPIIAMRIQLRHLAMNETPLPVVGAWGRAEARSAWSVLPRRDVIHWSPTPDGRLIARARRSGGRVALAPAGAAVTGHLERSRPVLALRVMKEAARPWDAGLETLLGRLAPAKAEELILGLKLKPDETSGFLRACADDTRVRLAALFMDAGKPRGVTICDKTVIESGGAWRVAKTGELVCDAVLRVDQVIRAASGEVSYRGRIEYKGQTLPYWAPDHEIEKDTLRWIQARVGQAGLGEVVIGTRYWSKYALAIAQQFEPPQAARGLDAVGWDASRNAFTLPRFVLQGNGEVAVPDYVVPPEMVLPGAGLVPPESLTPGARVALAWNDEGNALFWAVAMCMLADILAPALGLPRASTALVGPGAIGAGIAVAPAFGCLTAWLPGDHQVNLTAQFRQLLDAHRWPLLVRRPPGSASTEALTCQVLGHFLGGVVAPATDWAGESLALIGGWHVITGLRSAATDQATEHGGTILRAYLLDLCKRRLNLAVPGTLIDAIHADLAAWYDHPAAIRTIADARRRIAVDDPTEHPNRFGRLVCRLIDCGELRLTGSRSNTSVVLLGDDRVHIPKWSLNEILVRRRAIALDAGAITTQLNTAGILLEGRDQDYVTGWVVSERWLRQHMDAHRQEKIDLKIGT